MQNLFRCSPIVHPLEFVIYLAHYPYLAHPPALAPSHLIRVVCFNLGFIPGSLRIWYSVLPFEDGFGIPQHC